MPEIKHEQYKHGGHLIIPALLDAGERELDEREDEDKTGDVCKEQTGGGESETTSYVDTCTICTIDGIPNGYDGPGERCDYCCKYYPPFADEAM